MAGATGLQPDDPGCTWPPLGVDTVKWRRQPPTHDGQVREDVGVLLAVCRIVIVGFNAVESGEPA